MDSISDLYNIDIKENFIRQLDKGLLSIILRDRTKDKNIIWGTDIYSDHGTGFGAQDSITQALITGKRGFIIRPRTEKSRMEQEQRIRNKAEVFTPSWICNKQNNLIDNAWFEREGVFNTETENGRTTNPGKIVFSETSGKTWQDYIKANRMEIACGEAPYLTSRYDTVSGGFIEISDRIGLLDRKLRVIGENADGESEWVRWAYAAYRSVYGFDYQGDNVLIARENLLFSFIEAYTEKFGAFPNTKYLREIAKILSWNIWQMDGLKSVVPGSCSLYCKIMDWETRKSVKFISLGTKACKMTFDAIVGNPPYQIMDGGAKASAKPVYNIFVDTAKKINPDYLSMIIPARWYAGGKGLDDFRESMLNDTGFSELVDHSNSADCFPSLGDRSIKGGICYFLWKARRDGKCLIKSMDKNQCSAVSVRFLKEKDCNIFIRDSVGVLILNKIKNLNEQSFSTIVSARKPFGLATDYSDFDEKKTNAKQCIIYALKKTGFIDRYNIARHIDWIDEYKLFIPEAIGNADVAADRIKPILGEKGTCCTETYLVVGPFEHKETALNCKSYINTRFFHFLLSLKKITQHTTQKCYEFIPLQNFAESWTDEKLFSKYDLTEEEINHINNRVWLKRKDK